MTNRALRIDGAELCTVFCLARPPAPFSPGNQAFRNSDGDIATAVQMSLHVIRTFVKLREELTVNTTITIQRFSF